MRPLLFLALAAPLVCSCGAEPSTCVEALDLSCKPLYAPTFDQVYAHTLAATCAQSGASCHAAAGAQGGLVLDDPDVAYARLTEGGADALVLPGDAACSPLVARIEATDAARVMPPGSPLAAAERCAVEQWIQDGAKR